MRVLFSPVVNLPDQFQYSFDGEKVTVTYKGVTDEFDFTGSPDGQIDLSTVETVLEFNPIMRAERADGILYLEVINSIEEDASEAYKFPNWIEV